ncbi:MAG: serine O-acetyltransferase [Dehalococcoidia bacterium]|nr:serine O-acetyltransferase [Dehalococcoidia bacterium]
MGWLARLQEDIRTAQARDPAARSAAEVLLTYPGVHALILHRLAQALHDAGLPVVPRLISHLSRFLTGIEIHPGARIGRRFFIDHGMGVVIGETTVIGDDCHLYQGVTLGGTSTRREKRHPTLEDGVVVGAGAKIIGAVTIGAYSRIGAGAVVVSSVPPNATVVGVPGHVVAFTNRGNETVERLPDPEWDRIDQLERRIDQLERRLPGADGADGAGERGAGAATRDARDLQDAER